MFSDLFIIGVALLLTLACSYEFKRPKEQSNIALVTVLSVLIFVLMGIAKAFYVVLIG